MSDELRKWLEEQRIIAESATEPEREIMMALIAKVEELAGALYYAGDLLASDPDAMKSAWSDHPADIEHFDWVRDQIASALRAPGGGS